MDKEYKIALIQSWDNEMFEIPADMFYKMVLPFGWHLIGLF